MKEFVENNHKTIIVGLLLLIIFLIMLLIYLKKENSIPPNLGKIPPQNLENFVRLLNDPELKVHGLLLLTPNKKNDLVVLNSYLEKKEPCATGSDVVGNEEINKTSSIAKTGSTVFIPITVSQKCTAPIKNLKVFDNERRVLVLTPGKIMSDDKESIPTSMDPYSFVFLTDLDPKTYRSGYPCRHGGGDC
jgi:hypothetical protein